MMSENIRKRSGKLANDIAMASANLDKYVPPYKEKRANKTHRHGYTSIRILNLPESMVAADFERQELWTDSRKSSWRVITTPGSAKDLLS